LQNETAEGIYIIMVINKKSDNEIKFYLIIKLQHTVHLKTVLTED